MSAHRFRSPLRAIGPLCLLFALCLIRAASAAYAPVPVPAYVQRAAFDAAAVPPAHQGADDDYWLLLDEQYDLARHSHYLHVARKACTETGVQALGRLSIDFDPGYQRLRFHRLAIWRGGRMRQLLPGFQPTTLRREADWEEGMLDGRLTLIFKFEDLRAGDILEYEYTVEGDNPIFLGRASGSANLRFPIPMERRRLLLAYPSARNVYAKALNGAPEGEVEPGRSGGWTRAWDLRRTAPVLVDPDAPLWYEGYPRVQWSEYADWAAVRAWASAMYDFRAPLSPALERWVERHKGLEADGKLRAAVKLAQDSIRYLGLEIGVSSHKPAPPGIVYARRYGDCKDKAFLLSALLRRLGFAAYPALVNTVFRQSLEAFQPSPSAFDHVIVRVEVDHQGYWIDATQQGMKGDPLQLQEFPYGKALVLAPGAGPLEDIKLGPDGGGQVEVTEAFRVAKWDSTISLDITTEYGGGEAESVRFRLNSGNREALAKEFLDFYSSTYPHIREASAFEVEDDTVLDRLTLREHYRVDSLCERAKETGRLGCSIYPKEVAVWLQEPDRRQRTSPYPLAFPKKIAETISIESPSGSGLLEGSGRLGNPEIDFSWSQYGSEGKQILAYRYEALAASVPEERFPAYLGNLDEIHEHLGITVYPESSLDNPNYMYILFLLASGAASVWGARRLLKMPVRRDPDAFNDPWPVGGALALIGIGIFLRPLLLLREAWQLNAFLDQGAWNTLTVRGGEKYHPLMEPVLLSESALTLAAIAVGFALWPLFARRSASFPRAYALSTALAAALALVDAIAQSSIPLFADSTGNELGSETGSLIWMIAWSIYLFRGERPRNTFVFPRPPAEAPVARPMWGAGAAAASPAPPPGEGGAAPGETDKLPLAGA
jgi:transglutaminase-like putative cysteine protease